MCAEDRSAVVWWARGAGAGPGAGQRDSSVDSRAAESAAGVSMTMATPPDSPIEEVNYEIEPSRLPKHRPVALEDLCRQTKFTRQEIRVMYRGFKQVYPATSTSPVPTLLQ
ncbi:hypothetical protein J6590_001380 [Homalodisca vitripennis]|nr:hypothetical protein J6590_001380 [Homalodisca vitripennis]